MSCSSRLLCSWEATAMGLRRSGACALALILFAVGSYARGADTPLMDAAERSDRAGVRALLDHRVAVNQAQPDGMTALHWAAYQDDLETAKLLVDARADVKAANRYGVTPLSLACTNGDGAMVELFLGAGGDPNKKIRGNEAVLMSAERTGKIGQGNAFV